MIRYPCVQKQLWGCKGLVAESEHAKMQTIIEVLHLAQSGHSPHCTLATLYMYCLQEDPYT